VFTAADTSDITVATLSYGIGNWYLVRGDTAQGGTKPATLETGVVVQVPLFLNEGDVVKVDTRTGDYLGRVAVAG